MNSLINDNFLLEPNAARELYNEFAKDLPIVDYHCHIDAKEIAEDINFKKEITVLSFYRRYLA